MKHTIENPPRVGWGILSPDTELTPETEAILIQLEAMPRGQVDLLLTRAVGRYLCIEGKLRDEIEPSRSDMVTCTTGLSNFWIDILGKP